MARISFSWRSASSRGPGRDGRGRAARLRWFGSRGPIQPGGEDVRRCAPSPSVRFPRSFERSCSGAAMTSAKSCCWAILAASTAERRAANSTESAWRSPVVRGVPSLARESASRAARIASSGSDFAPLRRLCRSGRSSSTTSSSSFARWRVRPAPWLPVPSIAQARRPDVLVRELRRGLHSLRGRLDGDLGEHPAGAVRRCAAALWVATWVSTPITTSTISDRLSMRCSFARRDVVGSGPDGERQDCDGTRRRRTPEAVKLLIRPELQPGRGRQPRADKSSGKARSRSRRWVTLAITDPQPSSVTELRGGSSQSRDIDPVHGLRAWVRTRPGCRRRPRLSAMYRDTAGRNLAQRAPRDRLARAKGRPRPQIRRPSGRSEAGAAQTSPVGGQVEIDGPARPPRPTNQQSRRPSPG